MVFYVNIWTGMASNNTISWSATYDSTVQYWPISALNTALHRRFISTPRWAMSIFLLKSDGGTPQNMRFNVFVIRVCSIYGENNIWHARSWRFTLAVEVVSQTALYHAGSLSSLNYVKLCKVGKVWQSRNLLDPFTAHDTAGWWANW